MYKKKNVILLVALVCSVAALLFSVIALASKESRAEATSLERQLFALQEQVNALTAQLDGVAEETGLADWNLSATAWKDGSGADVTLTAVPVVCPEGTKVQFLVKLDEEEVVRRECTQSDSGFNATVSLTAADGYSYYCVLQSAEGGREEIPLATPSIPTEEALVSLKSSLSAYGVMTVEAWEQTKDGELLLQSGNVELQIPLLPVENMAVTGVALVLKLDGAEIGRWTAESIPAMENGRVELPVKDVRFPLPELSAENSLELILEAQFSDGQSITAPAAVWFPGEDGLSVIVG